jgi:hypothetical protein
VKLRPYNDPEYRRARATLTALMTYHGGTVPCWKGCGRPATTIDHQPAILEHNHRRGTGCCTLKPSCEHCNKSHGATIGNQQRRPKSTWLTR